MTDPDLLHAFALAQQRQSKEAQAFIQQAMVDCQAARRPLLEHGRKILTWFNATHDGHFYQGLDQAIEGMTRLQECGYRPALVWAMGTAGFCMAMSGHVELGLKWTDECIREASRQDDEAMVRRGRSNRASLLGLLGSFEEATEAFEKLIETMRTEVGPDKSSILNNLAFCHLSLAREMAEDPPRRKVQAAAALLRATQAMQGLEATKDVRLRVWSLSNRGAALTILGRHAEAEAAFLEALPHAHVNPRNGAVLMAHYALLLVELGRLVEAAGWVAEALAVAPAETFDSTLDLVLESQLQLAQAAGDAQGVALCSQRRLARLQASRRVRVRSAVEHIELNAEAERARIEERERVEAEVRAARRRLEETQQSLLRAELETQRAQLKERERLLQDMHDGFGSLLASARIQASTGSMTTPQMVEILDECAADLYLVADTLSEPEGSLADALADFRFRCDRRFSGQQIDLTWDIRLTGVGQRGHRRNLQVLRVVQEALNNALRHANAQRIRISAGVDAGGSIRIEVSDDGRGMTCGHKVGKGLGNMLSRARDIGASLVWEAANPGTAVVLTCPQHGTA